MAKHDEPKPTRGVRRIPQQSLLYERLVPLAMLGMGILLVLIVLLALGIFLGVIRF